MTQNVLATNLVVEHVEAEGRLRLRLAIELPLKAPDLLRCCEAHRQSPSPHQLRKRTRSRGPLLHRHYPASSLLLPRPTPAVAAALRDVEAATLARQRVSPYNYEPPFRRAVPTTPADRAGARVDCFPADAAFPKWQEGRHPHCHYRGLLRLHTRYGPPGSLSRPRRPLSRGSDPASYPPEPLASFRTYRQLSGWNLPPLMICAFGAHAITRLHRLRRTRRNERNDRKAIKPRRIERFKWGVRKLWRGVEQPRNGAPEKMGTRRQLAASTGKSVGNRTHEEPYRRSSLKTDGASETE